MTYGTGVNEINAAILVCRPELIRCSEFLADRAVCLPALRVPRLMSSHTEHSTEGRWEDLQDVNPQHPPNQKQRDDSANDMDDPIACDTFALFEGCALRPSAAEEHGAVLPPDVDVESMWWPELRGWIDREILG
jgi:hypothetical protein